MSEWEQRQLCPDDSCIGVIGSDGTCKVCGRVAPNWGDERKRGLIETSDDVAPVEDAGPPSVALDPEAQQAWDERRLCPDDACIGLLGSDGACKVCGRRAA
jgi:hypothetical protein